MADDENRQKMAAAESAVAQVRDGMVVGLGTGSTASLAIEALARRVRAGLRISAVPTSERTAAKARELGIPLVDLAEEIDLTIDGADEVQEWDLSLIKGRGGALLREKIVARASKRVAIMVDASKLVKQLGDGPLPVEVVPFGWQATARQLTGPRLRLNANGDPFLTDGGHFILDCAYGPIELADRLAEELDHVVGVVEHGLFVGLASEVHVGESGGVRVLKREA